MTARATIQQYALRGIVIELGSSPAKLAIEPVGAC